MSDDKVTAQFGFEVGKKTGALIDLAVNRYFETTQYSVKSLQPMLDNDLGHYLISFFDNPSSVVLHIKSCSSKKDLDNVCKILKIIDKKYVNFAQFYISKNGCCEATVGPYFITVTEYFSGRHFKPKISDIKELALGLSNLHRALLKISDVREVEQATRSLNHAKVHHLHNGIHSFRQRVPRDFHEVLSYAKEHVDINWNSFGENQICHGDLSPGNVLFDDKDQVVFLDFETAATSYKPVYADVGMCGLRYCLSEHITDSELNISAFIDNYSFKRVDRKFFLKSMANVACNSAITLDYLMMKGDKFRLSEWQKVAGWLRFLKKFN